MEYLGEEHFLQAIYELPGIKQPAKTPEEGEEIDSSYVKLRLKLFIQTGRKFRSVSLHSWKTFDSSVCVKHERPSLSPAFLSWTWLLESTMCKPRGRTTPSSARI